MNPQIGFAHVLSELSVNREDPCEVLRELISNSYDAGAKNILYLPLVERKGIVFFDDGEGLSTTKKINGITPWEAFFSIGKSTKMQGDTIGYKCQGSKLLFASARVFVATKEDATKNSWNCKVIDNPRDNLDLSYDITPQSFNSIKKAIEIFYPPATMRNNTSEALKKLYKVIAELANKTSTLIIVDELDIEDFSKFIFSPTLEESYAYNYIRFNTRHGDVRWLTPSQGFTPNHLKLVSDGINEAKLIIFNNKELTTIPFGFHYLDTGTASKTTKSPSEVSRIRDGQFFSRTAIKFQVAGRYYSVIFSIDGHKRALDEYKNLDRSGGPRSGIKLMNQRGVFISVSGIKICKYQDIFSASELDDYRVLAESKSSSHYSIIIEGSFDLVTNRNSLSQSSDVLLKNKDFLKKFKGFLDNCKTNDQIFSQLLSRLRKDSTEKTLTEQMKNLESTRNALKTRERFRITDNHGKDHLFLSPQPGEEYLVGVLYAALFYLLPPNSEYQASWKRIITFSTQGIDSLGLDDPASKAPLSKDNILAIEYKYAFVSDVPFNHALPCVDYIVAWEVEVDSSKPVKDSFTCHGNVRQVADAHHEWEIFNIENEDCGTYGNHLIRIINLKELIRKTFNVVFSNGVGA